ncbi:IMPACT family protein [Alkanindiges sp. WGS2144]|uniref:IMPACT family protein n=1 Tax=Alkanindiges sp. WGS2144 TaxID=3366808 RepID=UPI003752EA6B
MTFSIAQIVSTQQDIKKSRFSAIAAPVASIAEAQAFLAQQHDGSATHQCWAWKIHGQSRVNDDGEPGGTAGRPILAVIEGQQLDNVVVLVNRWYGGIKLGTGGLVRAYGSTAQLCLQQAEKIENLEKVAVQFFASFSLWPRIDHYLTGQQLRPVQLDYQNQGIGVELLIGLPQKDELSRWLMDVSAGKIQLKAHIDDQKDE